MHCYSVTTFEQWRDIARPLLIAGVNPGTIVWREHVARIETHQLDLPNIRSNDAATASMGTPSRADHSIRLPNSLLQLLEAIANFRDAGRWELMYRLAYRTSRENLRLVEDAADPDVRKATLMERAIRRDCHNMHAFVRFRELDGAAGERSYFAWFEPEHQILRHASSFFVKRFANMSWTIATPDGAAVWNQSELRFVDSNGDGNPFHADSQEALWRTYYRSVCNVARINPASMKRQMPRRYWGHLPEAAEVGALIRDGLAKFRARQSTTEHDAFSSAKAVLRALARLPKSGGSPQSCQRCDVWRHATQAVEGEGNDHAQIMLVGEQPGEEEDLRGHPFVGPAGAVLNDAIAAAGLIRTDLFITNAVKHFKWKPHGKRRLHAKPDMSEIAACNFWLMQEISSIQPAVIVALGGSALRALTGGALTIAAAHTMNLCTAGGVRILATYHPSAILRSHGVEAATMNQQLIHALAQSKALGLIRTLVPVHANN